MADGRGPGRSRRRHRASAPLLAGAAVLWVLGACTSDDTAATSAPEGYDLVTHPEAEVALPSDWEEAGAGDLGDADPDAQRRLVADAPDGLELGGALWRYSEQVDRAEDAASLLATQVALSTGMEEVTSEPVEVEGAEGGHMIQLRGDSPVLDGQEVTFTYISALLDGDRAVVVRLAGTADQVPQETVDTVVETLRITEG